MRESEDWLAVADALCQQIGPLPVADSFGGARILAIALEVKIESTRAVARYEAILDGSSTGPSRLSLHHSPPGAETSSSNGRVCPIWIVASQHGTRG
jgi:hypothetical protein